MLKGLIALALLMAFSTTAHATDAPKYPLVSLARLHVGVRGEYEWASLDAPTIQNATSRSFRTGLGLVYSMVPHLSAIGRVTAGLGSSPRYVVGLNYELFSGTEWAAAHPVAP